MYYLTYFQFFKSEASAIADFGVILEGWTPHYRSEVTTRWTGGHSRSLLETLGSSCLLLAWLVEPGPNPTLPVLLKMGIRNNSVSHRSHDL